MKNPDNTQSPDAAQSDEQIVGELVDLLTVKRTGDNAFVGHPQIGGVGRVFGGQVIAQALQAAQATMDDAKVAHSLHAYFLRGGTEGVDIDLAVERDFDGRSFANRRVVASQEGTPILNLVASFQTPEDGVSHQHEEMPQVPAPEDLESDMVERARVMDEMGDRISDAQREWMLRPRPIEIRQVGEMHWQSREGREPVAQSWFRCSAPLPDDDDLHRAMIAYASDFMLLGTAALPHGLSWMRGELISASLDHALWFHRPARADDWLLYATDSPWSGSGRGFNRGRIYNRDGVLVASVAQEGMIRARKKPPENG
jgi:acyl-CoA thioesterase-2